MRKGVLCCFLFKNILLRLSMNTLCVYVGGLYGFHGSQYSV